MILLRYTDYIYYYTLILLDLAIQYVLLLVIDLLFSFSHIVLDGQS
jgi:hypothetical protein